MHGQKDWTKDEKRRFFHEVTYEAAHQAVGSHNTVFLHTFWNIMMEVFRGNSPEKLEPAYFNIPVNTVDSSQGGAAPAPQPQ